MLIDGVQVAEARWLRAEGSHGNAYEALPVAYGRTGELRVFVHGHLGVEKVQALVGELKGFECLVVVEIMPLSDDLATLDRVDVRHANLGLDAAYPATDPPVHAGHNLVSRPEEFSEERFVLPLPGLLEALEEAADRGPTIEGSRLYPRHRGRHLGVWGIQLDEGVEVAAIPGVEPTARDVHSIVGHLSGSMPQRSSSDRRGSRYAGVSATDEG